MNLFEAFAELDKLEEDYFGQYKSQYLNLSETERNAAKDLWAKYSSNRLLATSRGWVTPGLLDYRMSGDQCKYILDYEVFHKAYDVELEQAGLLKMFEADGKLGPRGCYGNLKNSGLSSKDPLYLTVIKLWRWVHSEDEIIKRAQTVDKATADKMLAKAKADAEAFIKQRQEAEAKKAQEAAEKAEAEAVRNTLENLLPDALLLIDPDLLDQLEDAGSAGVDIGYNQNKSYIHVDKLGTQEIPKKAPAEYSTEFLANLITDYLKDLNLPAKINQHNLGLDIVKEFKAKAYWINEDTKETFEANADYSNLVNRKTKKEATPKEAENCTLALAIVSRIGKKRTYSAREDVSSDYYYSYNEELTLSSELRDFLPYDDDAYMQDQTLDYYDESFEEASKHGIFINFPTFDVWLHEAVTIYGTD